MIHKERITASLDGDFVVFLIGMRINQPLKSTNGCRLRVRCRA